MPIFTKRSLLLLLLLMGCLSVSSGLPDSRLLWGVASSRASSKGAIKRRKVARFSSERALRRLAIARYRQTGRCRTGWAEPLVSASKGRQRIVLACRRCRSRDRTDTFRV